MRILIADSAATVRSALSLLLEHKLAQVEILEAENISEVQQQAEAHRIDVALIDWHLRGGGPEAIRILRHEQPNVPIIVLSGRPEARREAMASQADDFVSKGDPPEALLTTLTSLARRSTPSEHTQGSIDQTALLSQTNLIPLLL